MKNLGILVLLIIAFHLFALPAMAVDPSNPPAQFQVTVEDPDNPGSNITVDLYRRSVRRGSNPKIWLWDSSNGYVETTSNVRTYRGFVTEYPNILICGVLFTDGRIILSAHDMEWGRGHRWVIDDNFSSQLPTAPAGSGLAYPSATLPPQFPVTRPPTIGGAVQPDSGIQVLELGIDVTRSTYSAWGYSIEDVVARMEHETNIYDMFMVRDCQVSVQVSGFVIRADQFYTNPGAMDLGEMMGEWLNTSAPLKANGWDSIHGSNGYYALQDEIGQDENSASAGAMFHEEGHNWDGVHSVYHYAAMEGNRPNHGPFNVERIHAKRLESINEGTLSTLTGAYSDPLHPFTYVDVSRVSKDTSIDIDVLANDWDSNGDGISVVSAAANFGTVSINADNTLHYTPAAGFEGKDIIVYTAQDDSTYQLKSRDLVHIEVVNNDLMVHYDFDETSGTIADNKTGNANLDGEIVIGDFTQNSVPSPVLPNMRGVRSINNPDDHGRYHRGHRGTITVGMEGNIIPSLLTYNRPYTSSDPWASQDYNEGYNACPFDWERGEHGNYCDPMDGDYSLAFWFKYDADDFEAEYDVVRLATKFYNREWGVGFSIFASQDGRLSAQIMPFYQYGAPYSNVKNWIDLQSSANILVPRKWHHAALVIDRTGGDDVRLYLDGQLVDENTTQLLAGQQIFMGRKPIRLGDTNKDKTCFDDLRIYAKALTGADINALWNMQNDFPSFYQDPVSETTEIEYEYSLYTRSLLGDISLGLDGPWTFTKINGPEWLNLTSEGMLFGYPASTDFGLNTAVIRVTDASGDWAEATYTITINSGTNLYWRLNESAGPAVVDEAGNHPGTATSGVTFGAAGHEATAANIPGGTESIRAAHHTDFQSSQFTIALWVNANSTAPGSVISYGTNPNGFRWYYNLYSAGTIECWMWNGSSWTGDGSSITAPLGTWNHIAATYDGSNYTVYHNGSQQYTTPSSYVPGQATPISVGRRSDNDYNAANMKVDGVTFFKRALSASEIALLYGINNPPTASNDTMTVVNDVSTKIKVLDNDSDPDAGAALGVMSVTQGTNGSVVNNLYDVIYTPNAGYTGSDTFTYTVNDGFGGADTATVNVTVLSPAQALVAHWKLDDGAGLTATDSSLNSNNGALKNGPIWTVDGLDGGALEFDGLNDWISFGTGPSLSGQTDLTLTAWIKTSSATEQLIIQQRDSGYNGEYMFRVRADGTLHFMLYGNEAHQYDFGTTTTVNDGQWHFVTAVRSGQDGYIYIDGNPAPAASATGPIRDLDPTIGVVVGRDIRENNIPFNGTIDDVRIYRYALSTAELSYLHDSYFLTPPTGLVAIAGSGDVSLDWANNTEPDLAGYKVYRSTSQTGPFSKIADDIPGSYYEDNDVAAGMVYFYYVTAFDLSANESSGSNPTYASMRVKGDMDGSNSVDLEDLALFAKHWYEMDCWYCNGADFSGDEQVDFEDLQLLADNWLTN